MMSILRAVAGLVLVTGGAAAAQPAPVSPVAVPMPFPPTPPRVRSAPTGSPASWLSPDDYPPAALRFEMAGVTAFRLMVGPDGAPRRCEITASSGFDVLDDATCERLMKNASFVPARDAKGRPVTDYYSNRVRWAMPDAVEPFHDAAFSIRYQIDQSGRLLSCQLVEGNIAGESDACRLTSGFSPEFGIAMRGRSTLPTAEVFVDQAHALGKAPPSIRIVALAGYEFSALQVFSFKIDSSGKMSECRIVKQRGSAMLIDDFCRAYQGWRYEVPFDLVAPDGSVDGWAVNRILVQSP